MTDNRTFTEKVVENKPEWLKKQLLPRMRRRIRTAKYGSKRSEDTLFRELAGRSFQSKLERDRARELCVLLNAKEIRRLEFQPRVFLSKANISYRADFRYEEMWYEKWRLIFEDTKGLVRDRFRIIKRLWNSYGPKIEANDGHYGIKAVLRITVRASGQIRTQSEIWPVGQ